MDTEVKRRDEESSERGLESDDLGRRLNISVLKTCVLIIEEKMCFEADSVNCMENYSFLFFFFTTVGSPETLFVSVLVDHFVDQV